MSRKKNRKKILGILSLDNIGLKIFSLAIALALSYHVSSEKNLSVIGFKTQIEFIGVPADMLLVEPMSPSVQVTVRGPSYRVREVATSPETIQVNLPDNVEKARQVNLTKDFLNFPPSIEVIGIEPARFKLRLEKKVSKIVNVVLARVGNAKSGRLKINPKQVTISGPESEIDKVKFIETELLDLRKRKGIISEVLNLRQVNLPHTTIEPNVVNVIEEVEKKEEVKINEEPK